MTLEETLRQSIADAFTGKVKRLEAKIAGLESERDELRKALDRIRTGAQRWAANVTAEVGANLPPDWHPPEPGPHLPDDPGLA